MSKFLYHSACPKCGSRDNLGTWTNGSWCFGCGYQPRLTKSPYLEENINDNSKEISLGNLLRRSSTEYTRTTCEWIGKYGVDVSELLICGVRQGNSTGTKEYLQFCFYDTGPARNALRGTEANVRAICTRVFYKDIQSERRDGSRSIKTKSSVHQPKYLLAGDVEKLLPIYPRRHSDGRSESSFLKTLVITEDCLSAIKVARQSDAMPCLTSTLSASKIKRLASLLDPSTGLLRYDKVLVWLDGDMFHKSQKIARMFQHLEVEAHAIYSKDDPKCYNNPTIAKVLVDNELSYSV